MLGDLYNYVNVCIEKSKMDQYHMWDQVTVSSKISCCTPGYYGEVLFAIGKYSQYSSSVYLFGQLRYGKKNLIHQT